MSREYQISFFITETVTVEDNQNSWVAVEIAEERLAEKYPNGVPLEKMDVERGT